YGNANALQQLINDPNVEVRPYPEEVLELLESITLELVEEMSAGDALTARIQESYYAFLEKSKANQRITEQAYLETRD
ncbi:MAG: ABC transporter substrate-binding protein, partial [Gammaproteobacteria bacterium]|nr:ABC transporter substrate-binding protein [Gammaproteobacteria bacterium]